jgi:NAD(P)-dependent dehydrogenase (short-subunit alcohol dehydrogenase family)
MIDLGLDGARAIVVGAGFIPTRAGHGRGSALRLAAAGATVACVDLDAGRAGQIATEIQRAGGKAFAVVGDVRTERAARQVIDEAVAGLGGVDVLVDVVGEAIFAPSHEQTEQDWDYQMTKNLKQFFFVMKAVLPPMIEQGTGGAITAITSVDGFSSSRFHAAYGAAKAGLISLVKTYSDEFGGYGIRVNCVAPGNVGGAVWDKPDVPFGQDPVNSLAPPRPMDIANGALFLSSSLAARVTGQTLVVDGGATTRSPWAHATESQPVGATATAAPHP